MSSGIDIQFVQETYQKMSDKELIRVLTTDAAGLTPEALELVKAEVSKRKLDPNIAKGIDAQQRTYTVSEIDTYCGIIQKLPCPITGETSEKLNATLTAEVMSFIIFTHHQKKIIIGSPAVLDKANNSALVKTLLLGWWGIPWGVIRTIEAITINLKNKKSNRLETPSGYLRSFVLSKIGQIETYKDNKEMLLKIISDD
jgi:hypothetical protein